MRLFCVPHLPRPVRGKLPTLPPFVRHWSLGNFSVLPIPRESIPKFRRMALAARSMLVYYMYLLSYIEF